MHLLPSRRPDEVNSSAFAPAPARPGSDEPLDAFLAEPRKRGWPILAWLVILALVGYVLYRNAERTTRDEKNEFTPAALVGVQSQGRYLVGATHLIDTLGKSAGAAGAQNRQELYKAARAMDKGSYSQRLRFATLAGELAGPDDALDALDRLEKDRKEGKVKASDVSIDAAHRLQRLYRSYQKQKNGAIVNSVAWAWASPRLTVADSSLALWVAQSPVNTGKGGLDASAALTDAEQERLRAGLGWFGDLALAPEGSDPQVRAEVLAPAIRTAITYITVFCAFGLGFLAGLVLLVIALVLVLNGKMRSGLLPYTGNGGIYAETFALYMLSYFGVTLVLGLVLRDPDVRRRLEPYSLLLSAGAMFLSLAVLAWPVLRGIPWQQVRADLGLRLGKRPGIEALFGPLTYLSAIPVLVVGVLIMFTLMLVLKQVGLGTDPFEPGAGPSHPIVNVALEKNWLVWLEVFLVASVAAPIVEEIMFRGVLYSHLREVSVAWGRRLSIVFSVLASSFVFAVIHPQGWLGVPVLMGLAGVFALAREWRGSLVPSMIAHGINNGVALLMLFLIAG
jgi:membrane protease YdiL (CAAX protease family)